MSPASYGWDNMDPNLHLAALDWLVGDPEELYSVYKEKGLIRLIYNVKVTLSTPRQKGVSIRYYIGRDRTRCAIASLHRSAGP